MNENFNPIDREVLQNFKTSNAAEIQERMKRHNAAEIQTVWAICVIAVVGIMAIIATGTQAQQTTTFHPGDILSADQLNGLSFQLQSLTKRVDSLEAKVEKLTRVALKNNVRVQKLEKK